MIFNNSTNLGIAGPQGGIWLGVFLGWMEVCKRGLVEPEGPSVQSLRFATGLASPPLML